MSDGLHSGLIAHVGTLDLTRRPGEEIVADLSAGQLRSRAAPIDLVADLSAREHEPEPSPVSLVSRLAGAEFDAPHQAERAEA
jgi:hypothetical protein